MQNLTIKESEALRTVYQVAHDMQSSLTVLHIIIAHSSELNEDTRAMLQSITSRIQGITKNMLDDFKSAKSMQDRDIRKQAIDCVEFLDQMISEKELEYQTYPNIFVKKVPHLIKSTYIFADPIQVGRSLSNLINNAFDALTDKIAGKITIGLNVTSSQVAISVQDNGVGMSKADVDKLKRRMTFTAGKTDGHGLGMTQVWDMLDDNGGEIVVLSKLGRGTEIEIIFPRHFYQYQTGIQFQNVSS